MPLRTHVINGLLVCILISAMDRRKLLKIAGVSLPGLALFPHCVPTWLAGGAPPTPREKRKRYLTTMLEDLCTDVGPHPVGSKAMEAVNDSVRNEMDEAGLELLYDEFSFTRWTIDGEPEFAIRDEEVSVVASHGAPGTKGQWIRGKLVKMPERLGTAPLWGIEDHDGDIAAYIHANENNVAHAVPYYRFPRESRRDGRGDFDQHGRIPMFTVGWRDIRSLDEAVRKSDPVRYRAEVAFEPETKDGSWIGTIPGKSTDEILIIAHSDTVYTSEGANDNTASLICMLMLARAFSGTRPEKTLTFFASNGEEFGRLGSWNYWTRRRNKGTLRRIACCINFDSLTWGENLYLHSMNDKLTQLLIESHQQVGMIGQSKAIDQEPMLDGKPFYRSGIPTVWVNSRGRGTEAVRHTRYDTAETVEADLVENSYRVFREAIQRLMHA